jgi:hypothetical protein
MVPKVTLRLMELIQMKSIEENQPESVYAVAGLLIGKERIESRIAFDLLS